MAKTIAKHQLVDVYDVVSDILLRQPVGEIEMVFEKTDNRRRLQIKGDKGYVLLCYENKPTKLFIDGDMVRDDIKSIPKRGFVSDIENMLYYNQKIFDYTECKDLRTDNIVFIVKKKIISDIKNHVEN